MGGDRMNKKNTVFELILNAFFILVSLVCILPFVLLFISSITDENTIIQSGYSLFPEKFSLYAYGYLKNSVVSILRAYGITIFVTVIGTVLSVMVMALYAYPLSRKDMPYKKLFTFIVFFMMIFNAGLVPTYMVYVNIGMRNSIAALIFPFLFMRGIYVMLMKTFFSSTIPLSIIESSKIDGAGEWYIFIKIILPISKPILATIGLFQAVSYWNDWFNGMIFLTDSRLYNIQSMLNRILLDIQFLTTEASGGAGGVANAPVQTVRMALAVIGVVPILLAYPFFQRFFLQGITTGAVKG